MREYLKNRDDARAKSKRMLALIPIVIASTVIVTSAAIAITTTVCQFLTITGIVGLFGIPIEWSPDDLKDTFVDDFSTACMVIVPVVLVSAVSYTTAFKSGGGRLIAQRAGGTPVGDTSDDLGHRRITNVVQEVAIASGVAVPGVYVLEDEPGINAFTAGFEAQDTVVAVTRGAIDRLTRDQLQGVVAHEFSHIENGDVRLKSRLLGAICGIEVITGMALFLKYIHREHSSVGTALALLLALVMTPFGRIGSLFATVLKNAINRQREFLADASAVEFTRNPKAFCEALRVIAAHEEGSQLRRHAAQMGFMCFASSDLGAFLQSHPSFEERIRRLEDAMPPKTPAVEPECEQPDRKVEVPVAT